MELTYSAAREKIDQLINEKRSFVVIGLGGELVEASAFIEKRIEEKGLSCRVYTRNRSLVAGAMSWTGAGLASLAGIAIHNLATFNPDYEIGRAVVDQRLYVDYRK